MAGWRTNSGDGSDSLRVFLVKKDNTGWERERLRNNDVGPAGALSTGWIHYLWIDLSEGKKELQIWCLKANS